MTDPQVTAARVKAAIGVLGGGFMISREAKALCERTGLSARALYFRGRCGVLGEVSADVILATTVFFPAEHVRKYWEEGRALPVAEAVGLYAGACHDWGRRRLGGFAGAARLAELLEPVVDNADVLGAPLFAGWREVPLADDPPARAAQLLHLVRELRGGLHAVAVLAEGLTPLEATLLAAHDGTPLGARSGETMARFFDWPEPFPQPGPEAVERRTRAEKLTDVLMAPAFSVLDEADSAELVELLARAG
ncbi:evbL [Streptosporangium fragile]|uniref:EvbL n=1 Tax=Streptosporangium fragile TaxID=46186 RepID=A0ABN3VRR3_9ACTN